MNLVARSDQVALHHVIGCMRRSFFWHGYSEVAFSSHFLPSLFSVPRIAKRVVWSSAERSNTLNEIARSRRTKFVIWIAAALTSSNCAIARSARREGFLQMDAQFRWTFAFLKMLALYWCEVLFVVLNFILCTGRPDHGSYRGRRLEFDSTSDHRTPDPKSIFNNASWIFSGVSCGDDSWAAYVQGLRHSGQSVWCAARRIGCTNLPSIQIQFAGFFWGAYCSIDGLLISQNLPTFRTQAVKSTLCSRHASNRAIPVFDACIIPREIS